MPTSIQLLRVERELRESVLSLANAGGNLVELTNDHSEMGAVQLADECEVDGVSESRLDWLGGHQRYRGGRRRRSRARLYYPNTGGPVGAGALVRVERVQVRWRDEAKPYEILVDDEKVGTVFSGRTTEIVVTPGRHSLKLKVGWAGSPSVSFAAEEDDTIEFVCRNNSGLLEWRLLQSIWDRTAWITLERRG